MMSHLWNNHKRQGGRAVVAGLLLVFTTGAWAGISVEPAWVLPVYERATGAQTAWVTNNMRSAVIKSAGGAQKSFAIGTPTLTAMSSLGRSTSSRRPDYYFGDQMTPPAPPAGYSLDWEAMTNTTAVKTGAIVLAPSVGAVYLSSAGMVSVVWHYVNINAGLTTTVTNEYYCSQGAKKRPYRAHWTHEPYNAPAVDLRGKFVSFHFQPGSELKESVTTVTNINGIVQKLHSPGLSINEAEQLQVYGEVSGMCLMQYFKTGSKQEQVGLDGGMIVVEVLAPAVIEQSIGLGEELRPLRKAYENAYGDLRAQVQSSLNDEFNQQIVYDQTFEGERKHTVYYPVRKTVSSPWNIDVYWMGRDAMGTEWPFERDWYAADWNRNTAIDFLYSSDAEHDAGFSLGDFSGEIMWFQEPENHITRTGSEVTVTPSALSNAVNGLGYSLLRVEDTNGMGFATLCSRPYNSPRNSPFAEKAMIGESLRPRSTVASLLCEATNAMMAWGNGFLPSKSRTFSAELWVWREEGNGSSLLRGLEATRLSDQERFYYENDDFLTTANDIVPFEFSITDGGRPELTVLRSAPTGSVPVILNCDYYIPAETWTHCAFSAGETSLEVYVNGKIAGATNLTLQPRPFSGEAPRMIVGDGFAGRLDDLVFWQTPLTSNMLARDARDFLCLPQTNLLAWYPISADQDSLQHLLLDSSGRQPRLHIGNQARIDTTSGRVGFVADTAYSYLHGFVYEPLGNQYNANWYAPGKGETEDSAAPIFAVDEGVINVWWRYGWKPTESTNHIYIPSVSQTFTNVLPAHMAEIVLASGLGSATTSLVERSSALLIGTATNAGVQLNTPISLAGDFSVELWFKLPEPTFADCGILSLSHDALKVFAHYGSGVVTTPQPAIIWQGDNGQKIVRTFPGTSWRFGEWAWLGMTKRANRITLYSASSNLSFSVPPPEAQSAALSSVNRLGRPWYAHRPLITQEAACLLDETRIWNRALTASELAGNRHRRFDGTEPGLVSFLPFDTVSGSLVYDAAAKSYFTLTDARLSMPGCPLEFSTTYPLSVTPSVYSQPNTNSPGCHPNDEHAFVAAVNGQHVVMALRDDLSIINGDTQNIVLVQYDTDDGSPESKHMDVFRVVRTNEIYTFFAGQAIAGQPLNGPSPLHLLPNPNMAPTKLVGGPAWRDRRLAWWAVADTGTSGVNQTISMQYFYPMQTNFWFPKLTTNQQPAAATPIPWLPEPSPIHTFIASDNYPTQGTPILYTWSATWPENIPSMKIGQTLTKATGGLPEMWNQSSVEIAWQTSTNAGQGESVILFDPTVARGVSVTNPLSYYGFTDASPAPTLRNYRGLTYFVNLPPDLGSRVYYDPNSASNNLVVAGHYVDNPAGTSYLLVNVLSSNQINEIVALVTDSNKVAEWRAIVTNLYTTPALAEPNVPVDHFALAAQGKGAGYVTLVFANSTNPAMTADGDPISMEIIKVETNLYLAGIMPITDPINLISEQMNLLYTEAFAGRADDYDFNWHYAEETASGIIDTNEMTDFPGGGPGKTRLLLGGPGSSFNDQVNRLFKLRYRARPGTAAATVAGTNWTAFTDVALAEGWLQRTLNALTPFEQRMRDLYENPVEGAVSMIQLAGRPYEGNVALTMDNMTSVGIIELYETLKNRASSMFPANPSPAAQKQLLLVSTRLNDMFMTLGNEAFADAMDPTIGFGSTVTIDSGAVLPLDYGTHVGSLFCFENQVPSLLDEELALLRGRAGDTGLQPPVTKSPYYNRLPWNFTKGITGGEVAYALNYNIKGQSQPIIDENTAATLYPQGHGDAWGHYLSAYRQYLDILRNPRFQWTPGITVMNLGGNPVNVDYTEEEKCAETAASLARTGSEVLHRVRQKAYAENYGTTFPGLRDASTNRAWGVSEWGARAGQAAFHGWLLANSLVPADHSFSNLTEGTLTNITRATVPSLQVIASAYTEMQTEMDAADARLNPLGLSENAVPFDISPSEIDAGKTHFEQILDRAERALSNADRTLRNAQQYSLALRRQSETTYNLQTELADQEAAINNRLIEIYGYPYSDDIGPGKTYAQDYGGPDLLHYRYISFDDYFVSSSNYTHKLSLYSTGSTYSVTIGSQTAVGGWSFGVGAAGSVFSEVIRSSLLKGGSLVGGGTRLLLFLPEVAKWITRFSAILDNQPEIKSTTNAYDIVFHTNGEGIPVKPATWKGFRRAEGEMQAASVKVLQDYKVLKDAMDAFQKSNAKTSAAIEKLQTAFLSDMWLLILTQTELSYDNVKATMDEVDKNNKETLEFLAKNKKDISESADWSAMNLTIGMSFGSNLPQMLGKKFGDIASLAFSAASLTKEYANVVVSGIIRGVGSVIKDEKTALDLNKKWNALRDTLAADVDKLTATRTAQIAAMEAAARNLQISQQRVWTLEGEGERLLEERERTRLQQANQIAAARYADMALRIFRNDAIQKYSSVFNQAARLAFLAAKAYAYETATRPVDSRNDPDYQFLSQIVRARTVGAMSENAPLVGSGHGDGGLADVLARLRANWEVLDGRLGFNNPSAETGRFSLRQELFRILPGSEGDENWQRTLQEHIVPNIHDIPEFNRLCIPFASSQVEPGLVIPFSTDISFGQNVFGLPLAGGDNAYDTSHFATKIRSLGVWFANYNTGTNLVGLANNPRVYLIPAGMDMMRTPDYRAANATASDGSSIIRWNLDDQVIPIPYPIGNEQLNDPDWMPLICAESGSLYDIRRYPSFRAYHDSGTPNEAEMISNARLIGRSVWNTRWLLIIPAGTLNNDRALGLDYFIKGVNGDGNGVKDIKLLFKTYSYSGN